MHRERPVDDRRRSSHRLIGGGLSTRTALVLGAVLAWAPTLAAQQENARLRVTVLAGGSDRPIANAHVRIVAGSIDLEGRTDADGEAGFTRLPAGVHAVFAAAPAFRTVRSLLTFEAGATTRVTLRLEPDPIPLASIDVEAEARPRLLVMAGFYDRAEEGLGTFLSPVEVDRRAERAARLSDLLRALPGLRVTPIASAPGTYRIVSRRGPVSIRGECSPAIWLDGIPLGAPDDIDINVVANPAELLALEIYDGPAEVPSAFRGTGGACGAILLWTGGRVR